MSKKILPLDTSNLDDLPISSVIYKPIENPEGLITDYEIVYSNENSAAWKKFLVDVNFVRSIKENLRTGTAFSYHFSLDDIHFNLQPIKNLPPPYVGFFLIDISDCEKNSAREHFLRSIRQIENAAILFQQDDDDNFIPIFATKEFAKMMECNEEDSLKLMSGVGYIATTHPDDRLSVKRMLRRRFSEKHTKNLLLRKITAKGNIIWCNVQYAFIDDFGEHYIYCTYFDVTNARVYAERLRLSYTSISDVFYRENDLTLGMFRVNLSKNIIEDMRGKDLFGTDSTVRSYSEVINLRAVNYPIKEERENLLNIFDNQKMIRAYLGGKNRISEYIFSRRKDGRFCYVNFVAMMTRHPISNEIIAFISEQEASSEKVQNALLDKILARQFDMVAYIVNGKYGVVLGDSTLIGKGSIFPLSKNGIYNEYLENQVYPVLNGTEEQVSTLKTALTISEIEKNITPDKPYIVNIACKIDDEIFYKRLDFYSLNPQANFFILLKSDTTEIQRKQIEQNTRLSEALEESRQANVAKTAFLSRMSHEIRTPMNAIIGLDNIALHTQDLTPTLKHHLEQIGQSARYLLSLINDILDMSRIESGRMNVKSEEFAFESFLEQIKIIVEGQCRDKGLNFHCNIIGAINPFYIGDDTKLKQVLINILGNSVKFTKVGGDITLEIECTAQFEGQSNFRFTMKDNGIGMDKEYLPKIFEAFSQEDTTTTSSYGGSGLGLAITKNIVEMMNGTITVESEKGVGTTFIVNIPLKNSANKIEVAESTIRPQDLKILIIDDDAISRDHARAILGESGIESESVESGSDALEIIKLRHARREDYNLILVDYHMPNLNGIEITKEIRKISGDDLTIIMITSSDIFELNDEATAAGVDGFISKPFSSSDMIYEIQQIISHKNSAKQEVTEIELEGRRVLFAEDMPVNAEILMMLLEMRNISADHAENGKIAVEMFKKSPPNYYDAILMDVRMPEMDGLEATQVIRKLNHPNAKTIPIIAMTANAFDEDVQRSLQAGMNAHLSKPVEPENMYRTLQVLIGKNIANK